MKIITQIKNTLGDAGIRRTGFISLFTFLSVIATPLAAISEKAVSHLPPQIPVTDKQKAAPRSIDIAIALDVSGSMDGLLDSARQRVWDIVNEFAAVKPLPTLRVALLTYGRTDYSPEDGWVRVDQPLTTNLDAISETLFAYTTNGGDEYVARVVNKAVNKLEWSNDPSSLRIIVVAGNEPATQDPTISIEAAMKDAVAKGVVVNSIYCGPENEGVSTGWQRVATLTDGLYASIDQDRAAIANIATPMDAEIAKLNEELNRTYLAYGASGARHQANQLAQDRNAEEMSAQAMTSRAVSKSSAIYSNSSWDLLDALKGGKKIEDFADKDLPENVRKLNREEREKFTDDLMKKRDEIQTQIGKLASARNAYILAERSKSAPGASKGLDTVLIEGLRKQALKKGFSL